MYFPLLFNTPYYAVIFYSLPLPLSLIIHNVKWTLFYQSFQENKCDLVDTFHFYCFLFLFHSLRFIKPRYTYLDDSSFHFFGVSRSSVKQKSKQTTPNRSGLTRIQVYFLYVSQLDMCKQDSLWNWGIWFFSSIISRSSEHSLMPFTYSKEIRKKKKALKEAYSLSVILSWAWYISHSNSTELYVWYSWNKWGNLIYLCVQGKTKTSMLVNTSIFLSVWFGGHLLPIALFFSPIEHSIPKGNKSKVSSDHWIQLNTYSLWKIGGLPQHIHSNSMFSRYELKDKLSTNWLLGSG